jgi:hypothetical protein
MAKPLARGLLLATVAFAVKAALAQTPPTANAGNPEEQLDVATPGGLVVLDEVVVEGGRANIQQATTEVVSVLSSEDIARTGEGDVAGALAHVPGLSVVGGGFVYVRGLGDRYSLALLNGSPLPSPEPLRRAVPLDLFPTDVIASSLVQKTYSPNYPGEFGGGVINLTTLSIPKMPFLKLGVGMSGNSETTGQLGYDYYGSKYDGSGYNFGLRDTPPALANFLASGERLSSGDVDGTPIASEFFGWRNVAVQKIDALPVNYSASATGGTSWDLDSGAQMGLVATAGFDNKWRTRDTMQQFSASADLSSLDSDYRQVSTEDHAVVNALVGLGYEQGPDKLRWTNLYVHDTVKRTALTEGSNSQQPGKDFSDQSTGWYERQLLSTQLTGSFHIDPLTLDARVSYSRSRREAPFETNIGYSRSNIEADPFGAHFINRLDNGQTGYANVAFSDLSEDLVAAGFNANWRVMPGVVASGGYDYAYTSRESERREFWISEPGTQEWNRDGIFLLRPDYLLSGNVIEHYGLRLTEPNTEQDPAFAARLLTHGVYGQLQTQLAESLELSAGVRYERGKQVVRPEQVFNDSSNSAESNRIEKDYFLPAATLTWKLGAAQDRQLRLHASRTIARPQFRELIGQAFYDPEANRTFRGNPLLSNSKFLNAEARYEQYFASQQRVSVAAFYKQIDKPIEVQTSVSDITQLSSYANAPEATLFGIELEGQRHFLLDGIGGEGGGLLANFLAARRLVLIGNYTWTSSKIKVGPGDTVNFKSGGSPDTVWPATDFFIDGSPLTGQSDHLLNLQIGLERPDKLSQVTLLFSYASDRVTSRGAKGSNLPDIYESPGVKVDLVARQGFNLLGRDVEFKAELRNLLREDFREFQSRGGNVVYYNKYDIGTSYSISVSTNF